MIDLISAYKSGQRVFVGADLRGATLRDANLRNANLVGADGLVALVSRGPGPLRVWLAGDTTG